MKQETKRWTKKGYVVKLAEQISSVTRGMQYVPNTVSKCIDLSDKPCGT